MQRDERDQVMYYCGVIRGICDSLRFGDLEYEDEEDRVFTDNLISKLLDISMDLEAIAKGVDHAWDPKKVVPIAKSGEKENKTQ